MVGSSTVAAMTVQDRRRIPRPWIVRASSTEQQIGAVGGVPARHFWISRQGWCRRSSPAVLRRRRHLSIEGPPTDPLGSPAFAAACPRTPAPRRAIRSCVLARDRCRTASGGRRGCDIWMRIKSLRPCAAPQEPPRAPMPMGAIPEAAPLGIATGRLTCVCFQARSRRRPRSWHRPS